MNSVYTEYLIEYNQEDLVVYVSGLDEDDYWIEIACHAEVNNPEDFAQGLAQGFKDNNLFASVIPVGYDDE